MNRLRNRLRRPRRPRAGKPRASSRHAVAAGNAYRESCQPSRERLIDLRDGLAPAGGASALRRKKGARGSRACRPVCWRSTILRSASGVSTNSEAAHVYALGSSRFVSVDVCLAQGANVGAVALPSIPTPSCVTPLRPATNAGWNPSALRALAISSASQAASCWPSLPSPHTTCPVPYASRASSHDFAHGCRFVRLRAEIVGSGQRTAVARAARRGSGSRQAVPTRAAKGEWLAGGGPGAADAAFQARTASGISRSSDQSPPPMTLPARAEATAMFLSARKESR